MIVLSSIYIFYQTLQYMCWTNASSNILKLLINYKMILHCKKINEKINSLRLLCKKQVWKIVHNNKNIGLISCLHDIIDLGARSNLWPCLPLEKIEGLSGLFYDLIIYCLKSAFCLVLGDIHKPRGHFLRFVTPSPGVPLCENFY